MIEFEQWDHSVHEICGDFRTQRHRNFPFIGQMHLSDHNGLEVAHVETNARKITHSQAASQDDQNYFLILQQKGNIGFNWGNNEALLLRPGEIALIDSSSPYSMSPQGLIQQISVHLPKVLLNDSKQHHLPSILKLTQSQLSGQMLLCILRQLSHANPRLDNLDSEEGMALQYAIRDLLRPTIRNTTCNTHLSVKDIAIQSIQRMLPEQSLSPETLAKELNISKRSLYRLFEEDNHSVAQYILEQRIEKSCDDILASDLSDHSTSITDIAFKWGFSDTSQFSRAFKRLKGVSPSQWRQQQHH